jgi:hypothetical protein
VVGYSGHCHGNCVPLLTLARTGQKVIRGKVTELIQERISTFWRLRHTFCVLIEASTESLFRVFILTLSHLLPCTSWTASQSCASFVFLSLFESCLHTYKIRGFAAWRQLGAGLIAGNDFH